MSQAHMLYYTPDLMMTDFIMDSGDSDVPMAEQSGLDTNRVSNYGGGGYIDDDGFQMMMDFIMDSGDSDIPMADQSGLDTNRVWDYRGDDDDDDDEVEAAQLSENEELLAQFSEDENHYVSGLDTNRVWDENHYVSGLDTNRVWDYRGNDDDDDDDDEVEDDEVEAAQLSENEELLAQFLTQFSEDENHYVLPSTPRSVVDNLDSVVITQQDVDDDNVTCAVCLDAMNVGDIGKQLPCFHRYHADCIVPWLVKKNTCPVCRFRLPTHDL